MTRPSLIREERHLILLEGLDPDALITCVCCLGLAPEAHRCGCLTGMCTVRWAIGYYENLLEILSK